MYAIQYTDETGELRFTSEVDFNAAHVIAEQMAVKSGKPSHVFGIMSTYTIETKAIRADVMRG